MVYNVAVKLLITGEPKSGKSTLLKFLLETLPEKKRGFITLEVIVNEERSGFDVVASNGEKVKLARTNMPNEFSVGKYFVEPNNLDRLIDNLKPPKNNELLYIDEIGQMQFLSTKFNALVTKYLESKNDLVATISQVYQNDTIEKIQSSANTILINLTLKNRTQMKNIALIMLGNRSAFNALPNQAQKETIVLAKQYLQQEQYICLQKLFKKAIYYYSNSVEYSSSEKFIVHGKHADHIVSYIDHKSWTCDCPLSNRKQTNETTLDCSHYMAVRLYKLKQ